MGDVLAYEAELLGLVKEVGFLSFFFFYMILARQDFSVFTFRARHCN